MRTSQVSIGNSILASQYNNLRWDAEGGSFLRARQQGTPDLTLYADAGVFYLGATRVIFAGGNSPSFTAPTTNPRIDLLTIDSAGVLARVAGTEAASPSVPAYPADKIVICEVYNRVGQTQIFDTDQTTNGYIKQDARPILGGSYISSDAQVDAAAAIQVSKINFNSTVLPDADGTRNLGSASLQFNEVRAKSFYANGQLIGGKFGGNGSDGALSITSGTTVLDVGGAAIFIKNYSSISITGTAKLAGSNPHSNGTFTILKSQGAVTVTSSTVPAIDFSGMGAAANTEGTAIIDDGANHKGGNGAQGSGATGGTAGSAGAILALKAFYTLADLQKIRKSIFLACGSGGGNGGNGNNQSGFFGIGGAGGRGGGTLYIECGGALNITSTINANGAIGSNGTGGGSNETGGGGGGGGAGGMVLILYNSLTANTSTITTNGGAGGNGGNGYNDTANFGGGGSGAGAGSYGSGGAGGVAGGNGQANGANGNAGSSGSGGSGGSGSGIKFGGGTGGTGGAGGTANNSLVAANTEFA